MSRNNDSRPTVFLDTNVLRQYLRGRSPESRLLSPQMRKRFRFAVNPVVLSELLLTADFQGHAEKLQKIQESVNILPINDAEAEQLLEKSYLVRTGAMHSNDLLIYSSAADCDYLVTEDEDFKRLAEAEGPVILTAAEFFHQAEHS